jgi:hypothetical protein
MYRSLLLAILSFPFVLGSQSVASAQVDVEAIAEAFEHVRSRGGRVTRDENMAGRPVIKINFWRNGLNDQDLRKLAAFRDVYELEMQHLTDDGWKELAAFKNLKSLKVFNTPTTDEAWNALRSIQNLTDLDVSVATQLTPAGLKVLSSIQNLSLQFWDSDSVKTDVELKKLAGLKNLTFSVYTIHLQRMQV